MRAVTHTRFAEPDEVLEVTEVPTGEPGPREVRIRMLLSPIHNHDLWTVRGTYGFKPELPARAGTEAVGVIEAVGDEVTGLSVGQRVATGGSFGAWAETFVTRAGGLIPVDDALPDEAAAQLVAMPFSAISLLHSLDLAPGSWLVQNAANGAVGRMVAQIAAARGVNVIGLVRRTAAVAELAEQGIQRIVATRDDDGTGGADWRDRVAELTGGAPIAAGVDSVGGPATADVASVLGDDAHLVIFGSMGAPEICLPAGPVIFRQLTISGFWGSRVSREMDATTRGELFAELGRLLASGELTLPVAAIHPLDEIVDAVRASQTPGRVGKVLLRP
ncbi:zinc-binding dehydrogenase [Schumannella sp. 10F1B-5-1]|uniref:zinc-binding dehydrogenase n=1 Tax=Schumannella sp. 10F1B-5-1 TaxID=2590780 RepID=UPI00112FE766|nr:zinc-binding dehydrogenase [Schumannella sp. 10F1B-5-1]TPW78289.1 zinc-binding dehydrogenase [Schumannella sp. 10F1B-5-1]